MTELLKLAALVGLAYWWLRQDAEGAAAPLPVASPTIEIFDADGNLLYRDPGPERQFPSYGTRAAGAPVPEDAQLVPSEASPIVQAFAPVVLAPKQPLSLTTAPTRIDNT